MAQLVSSIRSAEGPGPSPMVTTNQEGGTVCFQGAGIYCAPGQSQLGASATSAQVAAETAKMAQGLKSLGLNSGLAPNADVWDGSNPFMAYRSFGTDPTRDSQLVTAAVRADQAAGIIATAKHFPGHGSAGDSHDYLPTVSHSMATLQQVDLPPFEAAIKAGVPMIMVGHLIPAIDPTLPTSLSPKAMALLRSLGFNGVIITDDLMMGAIQQHYSSVHAAAMALQAGADMVMFAGSAELAEQAVQAVIQAINSGQLSRAQIDQSALRVLALKKNYGLLTTPSTPSG